jgi:hypothetical protein
MTGIAWFFLLLAVVMAIFAVSIVLKLEKLRPTETITPKTDSEVKLV